MTQPQTQTKSASYDASGGSDRPTEGRFVWHELMTTDIGKSKDFYVKLFGWEAREMDMGEMGTYTMMRVGEKDVGGMVPLDASLGIPSHWVAYATVKDVDAACDIASKSGGKVRVPPMDIPNMGRFALIEDPSGAIINPFTFIDSASIPPENDSQPATGEFCWDELLTTDTQRAVPFYRDIFGWTTEEMDMGPTMGVYTLFKRGNLAAAGMLKMPPDADGRPAWLPYMHSNDVDASARKIQELGGMIYVQPTDIPNVGRFAVAADTTGAMFAVYKRSGM